jgi:hypothetical protein
MSDEMRMLLPDRPPTPQEGAAVRWVLMQKIQERACEHFDPKRPQPAYISISVDPLVRGFFCTTCADPYLVLLWDPTATHDCMRCHKAGIGKPGIARMRVKPAIQYVFWTLCDSCKMKLLRIDRSKPVTFR